MFSLYCPNSNTIILRALLGLCKLNVQLLVESVTEAFELVVESSEIFLKSKLVTAMLSLKR